MAPVGDVKLESTVVFGQPWVSPPVAAAVRPRVVVAHVAGSKRPIGVPPGEARPVCSIQTNPKKRKVVMALKEVNSGDMGSDISTASGSSSTASERDEFEEAFVDLEGLSAGVELPTPARVLSDSLPALPPPAPPPDASHLLSALAPTEGQLLGQMIDSMMDPSAATPRPLPVGDEQQQEQQRDEAALLHAHAGAPSAAGPAGSATGAPNRKEWDAAEDAAIHDAVRRLGFKWRQIAALLPGRSDDAVRNRWARLNPDASKAEHAGRKPAESKQRKEGGGKGEPKDPAEQRQAWSQLEDLIIVNSVRDMGTRWSAIAQRIPRRTEHAIRNRWHRLQTNLNVVDPRMAPVPVGAELSSELM